ncbi:hypothetical protein VTJ04DRAFT_7900 [Mycothermus thermophilus]|uniref:uncharacterized protein n=1 Tax=Humicola insolens TaxID=85995 RepID=UPI0037433C12
MLVEPCITVKWGQGMMMRIPELRGWLCCSLMNGFMGLRRGRDGQGRNGADGFFSKVGLWPEFPSVGLYTS